MVAHINGEVVIWREGRCGFGAVRSRASPIPTRELAAKWPASYAVWDCLPLGDDLRGLPYDERRARPPRHRERMVRLEQAPLQRTGGG
ncbi:hypothetical protein ACYSUO_40295 [Streptomyces sp. UC4497]